MIAWVLIESRTTRDKLRIWARSVPAYLTSLSTVSGLTGPILDDGLLVGEVIGRSAAMGTRTRRQERASEEIVDRWVAYHQRQDPSMGFYRSWWGPDRAWFIQTAGFEYIFLD